VEVRTRAVLALRPPITSPVWKFLAPLFVLVGLPALVAGVGATIGAVQKYMILRDRGVTVEATVTDVTFREHNQPSGKSYHVTVRFMTEQGPVSDDLSVRGTSAEGVEVSGHVQVTYDSKDPSRIEVTDVASSPDLRVAAPILLFGLGLTSFGALVLVILFRRRRGRQME
jgi:hypothetical protein